MMSSLLTIMSNVEGKDQLNDDSMSYSDSN